MATSRREPNRRLLFEYGEDRYFAANGKLYRHDRPGDVTSRPRPVIFVMNCATFSQSALLRN
jgi:hypothetical protein